VHRLDKDTSGLLVVAKTLTAQTDLVRQLQARTVKRHYLALALGTVERDGTSTRRWVATPCSAPKWRRPERRQGSAHPLRGARALRQMHAARMPAGDRAHPPDPRASGLDQASAGRRSGPMEKPKSGDARLDAFPRQALHAWRLALRHPASGVWRWPGSRRLPDDFARLLESLRAEFIVPDWPAPAGVRALSTTRRRWRQPRALGGFNLGDHVGDDPAAVAATGSCCANCRPSRAG
jgi:23S rRNA pseudouridine1911/1915/1917 synthase